MTAPDAAKCSRCGLTNCSCVGGYGGPLRPTPPPAAHQREFQTPSAWQQRIGRAWQGFFATMTTILAWKYVSPWLAWGIGVAYFVLAMGFEVYVAGMERGEHG